MPLVRPLAQIGLSPNRGIAPSVLVGATGGAEPRLTSGGGAGAQGHSAAEPQRRELELCTYDRDPPTWNTCIDLLKVIKCFHMQCFSYLSSGVYAARTFGSLGMRLGRCFNSPSQFGQIIIISTAHQEQNVHS